MAPARNKGLGDLVLAKVKGFPPWPAKISRPEDWKRTPDPKKYFVQFFGTQEIAFVAPPDVQEFTSESKSKLIARCKGKTVKYFAQAVKEICEASDELDKNDWSDSANPRHDTSSFEDKTANGSCNELNRRPVSEELRSMEGLLKRAEFEKSSGCGEMLDKLKDMEVGEDLITEDLALVETKADIVARLERIESSRASSSSPYSGRSEAKYDVKMDSPMSLGASVNLKSVNGHKSLKSVAGSKRKIEGFNRHSYNTKSSVFVKDRIPQKLLAGEHVKRLPLGEKGCGEREFSRLKEHQPGFEQLQSVKKAKLVHSVTVSGDVKGSTIKTKKGDVEPKIHNKEAENKTNFGLGTLKSDIPKKRRAVCLYSDNNDDDKPKTPVHGKSLSTIIPNSFKNNIENHDTSSYGEGSLKVSMRDAIDSQNECQLKVESHSPSKEETNKRHVKMDLISPTKSPLVAAAKRSVDQQKPYRLPGKLAILQSHNRALNVPSKDLKYVSSESNSSQKSRFGERVKVTPKISSRCIRPASFLDNQMDHDSVLSDVRLGDAKDRSSYLVDPKALDSTTSMKNLIAAALAKRQQALTQTAPQGNVNSTSTPLATAKEKGPSPVSMTHDSSLGTGNATEHDTQETHVRGTPHVNIGQLDSEEPEAKRPGSTLSVGTEAAVARDAFEGMIETLSRTKESIGRATRLAIDCAKHGIVNEVVELLIHKLENEAIIHRKVDLFFLVDSITQCSHSQKGIAGASYIPVVQAALPRLLGAAAPSGSSAKENRRQCLKVLRLWLERKIFPESFLRHFMDDIGSSNDDASGGFSFRRPSRAERSVDDPIREMEGMLVDEYGSNATFNLPGFLSSHGFVDDINEDEENIPSTLLKETNLSPSQPLNNSGQPETDISTPNDKRHHMLEQVDGELEMEDVSLHEKDQTLSPNVLPKIERPEMILDAQSENCINDVAESPLMEGSPPLPPESPPPLPPLPTSPPPPLLPPRPSLPSLPPSPPPPPPMLPSQPSPPPSLVSSGALQVGNIPPLPPPQPSMAPQVFLHPPSAVPSVQAPPIEYSVSSGTHMVQLGGNTSQQVPCFPPGPSSSLNPPAYSSMYGRPHGGQSNQQFQQGPQFQPCQTPFAPRPFPPVTVPQPSSGHFSYNKHTIQPHMPQSQPNPPPLTAPSHSYTTSHSEGLRRVGDEQWRNVSIDYKSDGQHTSWMNGGRVPSCPPENFVGEAYFRPSEMAPANSMGYQVSTPNPAVAGPTTSGHGVDQMLPPMPPMSSLNYWRPV